MKDVQDKLGIKNMTQHVKNELKGKCKANKITKVKKKTIPET